MHLGYDIVKSISLQTIYEATSQIIEIIRLLSVEILAIKIVQVSDPRAKDPRMIAAKYSEIRNLIRRGNFKVRVK